MSVNDDSDEWEDAEWVIDDVNMDEWSDEEEVREENVHSSHNTYIGNYVSKTGLHLLCEQSIRSAFTIRGEIGLFTLFVSAKFKSKILNWINCSLLGKGEKSITLTEFDAYLGLEMAMSIISLNDISDYWSEKIFLGQSDFGMTLSRNRFQTIRANLQIHPPESDIVFDKKDPLWHSRFALSHFQKMFAKFAVPYGVSSFNESSIRTKARTRAKSYIPTKPDKYAIRFYTCVGWSPLYIHSFFYNGSGNKTSVTPIERYLSVFPELRPSITKVMSLPTTRIKLETPTALWVAMISQQAYVFKSPNEKRLVVCDNFYTRHTLAETIKTISDNEIRILGTVRVNFIDSWNKREVIESVKRITNCERGSWELIATVSPSTEFINAYELHEKEQKQLPANKQKTFSKVPDLAENAGYIVFKDKKVVIFYTNDLATTPKSRVISGDKEEAIICCNGLIPILRWTGVEFMHRKSFSSPAPVATYNKFMNAVDRVDQLRSTNPIRRKEMRLSMSVFTWLLDLSIINSYALYLEIYNEKPISVREFKRRIIESLTNNEYQKRRYRKEKKRKQNVVDVAGMNLSAHILTLNRKDKSGGRLTCYLCSLRGVKKDLRKSMYGCTGCCRGFHPQCHSIYHNRDALNSASPSVTDALDALACAAANEPIHNTRKRVNNSITTIDQVVLPGAES